MNKPWDSEFETFRIENRDLLSGNAGFKELSKKWFQQSVNLKYSYQFNWLGIPLIQMPADLIMFQEIVWETQPDLIIETGVARGGSLVFWASIQKICGIDGLVLGIDIDIRDHAKNAIKDSRFNSNIKLIEGSSTDSSVLSQVKEISAKYKKVMLVLDSNHTHEHVLEELKSYGDLVSPGCYLIVLDTVIDDLEIDPRRPWGPGKSPKSAVIEYMKDNGKNFKLDKSLEARAVLTNAPSGYWQRK